MDAPLIPGKIIAMTEGDSHYLKTVLRRTEGAPVLLFNGIDGEFDGAISTASKKVLNIKVGTKIREQYDEVLSNITLAFPPIRHARMDFLIEKATELGVKRLQPIITDFTQGKNFNAAKAFLTCKEAAEQSRRLSIPEIAPIMPLKKFLATVADTNLIVLDERLANSSSSCGLTTGSNTTILVGPEGGFSEPEFSEFARTGAKSMKLANTILRTETAATAALAILGARIE